MEITMLDRYKGALMGLAVGDALGTTVEFKSPGSFEPLTDIVGGGPFRLNPGEWTDDTSMALCLAESLIENKGFNGSDQMKKYCDWWKNGYNSSNGRCFDIGNTVSDALNKFQRSGDPFSGSTAENSSGNGCIMRLAPVPLFYRRDTEDAIEKSGESSRTTHGSVLSVDSTKYMAAIILNCLNGKTKEEILDGETYSNIKETMAVKVQEIINGSFKEKQPPEIRGTGFVVASLEASLWAFYNTDDFKSGCLAAVNLGDDADTTGAIYGQIAGAYYGLNGIPDSWVDKIVQKEFILELSEKLFELAEER